MAPMATRIAIIQGHPDPHGGHFCHALADAYARAATQGGRQVRRIDVATLNFPLLRTSEEFNGRAPTVIVPCQENIIWADHLLVVYPLWLGGMPALLRGFFEQVFRPGFAIDMTNPNRLPRGLLKGRSARIVVTMGMPALVYRWYFGAHSLKGFERSLLRLGGITPIRETLVGMVEAMGDAGRQRWLLRLSDLGRRGL